MKKMAQLLTQHSESTIDYDAIKLYAADLLERLMLGTVTDKLQGLSDTDVNVEVSTYLLWKSLNG